MDQEYYFFFVALQDEIYRLNQAIHRGIRPILYRQQGGYLVYGVTWESDYLWYETLKLMVWEPNIHTRWLYHASTTIQGQVGPEWELILRESLIERNPYFTERAKVVTGSLLQETEPIKRIKKDATLKQRNT